MVRLSVPLSVVMLWNVLGVLPGQAESLPDKHRVSRDNDFLTVPQSVADCIALVESVQAETEEAGQLGPLDETLRNADLLCQAGDFGEATVKLREAVDHLTRLSACPAKPRP